MTFCKADSSLSQHPGRHQWVMVVDVESPLQNDISSSKVRTARFEFESYPFRSHSVRSFQVSISSGSSLTGIPGLRLLVDWLVCSRIDPSYMSVTNQISESTAYLVIFGFQNELRSKSIINWVKQWLVYDLWICGCLIYTAQSLSLSWSKL